VLLVLAACSGDAHAFVELIKPHSERILWMLYRITNNWHDAEDAFDSADEVGTYSEWDFKDSRDNPEQCFERHQRADLIQSAIQQLPSKLRKVVVLRYSGDLSIKEIALSLSISQAAAKSRLPRARKKLRGSVRREASNSPTSAEPMSVNQPAFSRNSDGNIKASPMRRKNKNGSSSDLSEYNLGR
jgi:DNA-directed RNA polymerase specialized sigma24 family protein